MKKALLPSLLCLRLSQMLRFYSSLFINLDTDLNSVTTVYFEKLSYASKVNSAPGTLASYLSNVTLPTISEGSISQSALIGIIIGSVVCLLLGLVIFGALIWRYRFRSCGPPGSVRLVIDNTDSEYKKVEPSVIILPDEVCMNSAALPVIMEEMAGGGGGMGRSFPTTSRRRMDVTPITNVLREKQNNSSCVGWSHLSESSSDVHPLRGIDNPLFGMQSMDNVDNTNHSALCHPSSSDCTNCGVSSEMVNGRDMRRSYRLNATAALAIATELNRATSALYGGYDLNNTANNSDIVVVFNERTAL